MEIINFEPNVLNAKHLQKWLQTAAKCLKCSSERVHRGSVPNQESLQTQKAMLT